MKMNKCLVFVLIFFLVFSFCFKQVKASAASEDPGDEWNSLLQQSLNTTSTQIQGTMGPVSTQASQFSTQLLTMVFQLFGMVILFVLLMIMVEEIIKSSK